MKRYWGLALCTGVLLGGGATADAQGKQFEELAQGAPRVETESQLGSLFWSQLADCKSAGSDLLRRQCEGVRAARKQQVVGKRFVVAGTQASVRTTGFDDKANSLGLEVTSCVACEAPMKVGGESFFVIAARGTAKAAGGALEGSPIHQTKREFKSKAWADRWTQEALPRLRTEYLVELPDKADLVTVGNAKAYKVKVVGFRVYDPCDGSIVAAEPASNPARPDKSTCGATAAVEPEQPKEEVAKKPAEPEIPAELSIHMINTALAPARKAAQQCYATYGVAGNASFRITIDNTGKVTALEQKGDYVDTPTGTCLEKAVRATTFPQTRKARTTVDYPFMLR